VLIEPAVTAVDAGLLVAFHGYGQNAGDMLDDVRRIPGASGWTVVSVQALHRFYTRRDQRIVASWMTREDRDLAIHDNVAYVDAVVDHLRGASVAEAARPLVFVGFSQGAAMAYRAARGGRHVAAGIIALGGDIPPDVATTAADSPWPPVLVGAGTEDPYYTPAKCDADEATLRAAGAPLDIRRFQGGHEWTDEFRDHVSAWLRARQAP
jgi:predicted esterase